MRRWYLLLTLIIAVCISIYKFWALQRYSGVALTSSTTQHSVKPFPEPFDRMSIMTFNVAMKSKHFYWNWFKEGFFPSYIRDYLDAVVQLIREAKPDLVILTEMPQEFLPFEHRLVPYLADKAGMHAWTFGELDDKVIGFTRYIGGNAILSRYPLECAPQSPEKLPVHLATLKLPFSQIWVGGVQITTKDWQQNLQQTKQVLSALENYPSILAGDFNVPPESPTIRYLQSSQIFNGEFQGPPTVVLSDELLVTQDYIFSPNDWTLLEHRVIVNKIFNHRAVLSTFKIKR